MKKSPFTQQQIMVMIFGVAFSLLLTACKAGNTDMQTLAGPGTSGTGPFTTSSYETIIARNNSVLPMPPTQNEHSTSSKDESILRPGSGSTSIIIFPKPQPDADDSNKDKTSQLLIHVLPSSVTTQQCQGVQRQLQLLAEPIPDKAKTPSTTLPQSYDQKHLTPIVEKAKQPKAVDSLVIAKDTPIPILATVSNNSSEKILEQKHDCQTFTIEDKQGKSITMPAQDCKNPIENIQYVPEQSHQYYANIDLLKGTAQYRITFANTLTGIDSAQCPPLYLDIEIKNVP